MPARSAFFHCLTVAVALASVSAAHGAIMTASAIAPVVNGADQAQLVSGTNVTAPDPNDAIYMFSDRPAQGQSFTTGSGGIGGYYLLDAVTLQQFSVASYTGVSSFRIRITQLSGTTITVLATELAPEVPMVNNDYMTFTLNTPIQLDPNTVYGFDVGMTSGGLPLYGNNSNPFAGGIAYSTGDNGFGNALAEFRDGDRVFHVNLELIQVPEPSMLALLGLGLMGAAIMRRKRREA